MARKCSCPVKHVRVHGVESRYKDLVLELYLLTKVFKKWMLRIIMVLNMVNVRDHFKNTDLYLAPSSEFK